jgi:hypothetical protein
MMLLAFLGLEWNDKRSLFLSGLFMGTALLAHYDAVMVLPALAYRWWCLYGGKERGASPWRAALTWGSGVLLMTLPFYGPFLLSSGASMAFSYLIGARVGRGLFHNNLSAFVRVDGFYNAIYYLLGLTLLTLLAGWRLWRHDGARWLRLLIGLAVIASATTWVWPESWVWGGLNWAFLPFSLLLGASVLAPGASEISRTLWIWFGVPLGFYLFAVGDPRTHVYNIYPGWILLGAAALAGLYHRAAGRGTGPARAFSALLVCFFLLTLGYPLIAFVYTGHDFIGEYPETRPAIYPTLVDGIPVNVYFGFPRRFGWKVIGELFDRGVLDGVYKSNQIERVTNWYTGYAPRTGCTFPDTYILADPHPASRFDAVEVDMQMVRDDYGLTGIVTVGGQANLRIYQRGAGAEPPEVFEAERYDASFDEKTGWDRWASGFVPEAYTPTDIRFDHGIRLLGYRLEEPAVTPGTTFPLTLYWQSDQLIASNYVVFVHLIRDQVQQVGHGDSLPNCGEDPTPLWVPGETLLDIHRVQVGAEVSEGDAGLFVGMYDLFTGERLPVYLQGQRMEGDTVYLTTLAVKPLTTTGRSR